MISYTYTRFNVCTMYIISGIFVCVVMKMSLVGTSSMPQMLEIFKCRSFHFLWVSFFFFSLLYFEFIVVVIVVVAFHSLSVAVIVFEKESKIVTTTILTISLMNDVDDVSVSTWPSIWMTQTNNKNHKGEKKKMI